MIFSSTEFLVFFAVCLAMHWGVLGLLPGLWRDRLRRVFLLAASYYFYMSWNAYLVVLIIFSTLVDYVAAQAIEGSPSARVRKAWLVASLATNVGLLGIFKYTNFFLGNVNTVAGWLGSDLHLAASILLPVGISFYTFQSMSYTIDVFQGRLEATRDPVKFALYVSFFPQLVAGPIVRARHFLPQLTRPNLFANVNIYRGVNYFLLGLFKKVIISDWISLISDEVFANPAAFDSVGAWVGAVAYAIQIYCDFSGYTDMAIGAACLLGYNIPKNFDMPYLATNIREFWRRWHISLSTWLRDYLYIPLGGNRGSRLFTHRNLMITMLLGGLWHGANWRFVIWGGLHGLALVLYREYAQRFPVREESPRVVRQVRGVAGWVVTFAFVCFAWVFFRAQTLEGAWIMVKKMAFLDTAGSHAVPLSFVVLTGLVVLGHMLGVRLFARLDAGDRAGAPWLAYTLIYGAAIFTLLLFAPDGTQPFIYFQF